MLLELQRAFHAAVTSPDDGTLNSYVAAPGSVAARIDIHRSNVLASLADVLATAFPVVRRIVGPTFFSGLAHAFIVAAPPRVPQLSAYGAAFAEFIAAYTPVHSLPYLADVARLEWARADAYFATDASPLHGAALLSIAADQVAQLRFVPHPATRLIRSRFPLARIWHVNQPDTVDVPAIDMSTPANVLITRPRYEVAMVDVGNGDAAFVSALMAGVGFGEAAAQAIEVDAGFDLQATLQGHLARGTFAALN